MTVTVPIRTVSEANVRAHWPARAERAREQRHMTRLVLRAQSCPRPALPIVVTLTRVAPRELDDDTLRCALKAVRDGVADYLGVDDRHPDVGWLYAQRRGNVREYAAEVEVVRPDWVRMIAG